MSVSDLLGRLKPRRRVVRLVDGSIDTDIDQTRRDLAVADASEGFGGLGSPVPALERRLAELEATAEATSVLFTFEAIPRAELDSLKRKHPPTEDQWKQFREQQKVMVYPIQAPVFDLDAAAVELIAASCKEPDLSVEDSQVLWDQLSEGQAAELLTGAWEVQQEASTRPFSKTDIAVTINTDDGSITHVSKGSPSPPSTES